MIVSGKIISSKILIQSDVKDGNYAIKTKMGKLAATREGR